MFRVCAAGAFLFSLLFAGCGTLNTSQFEQPARESSLLQGGLAEPVAAQAKWYFDSASGKWYFDSKWYCDQD